MNSLRTIFLGTLLLGLVGVLANLSLAGDPDDPFALANKAASRPGKEKVGEDPFSLEYKAGPEDLNPASKPPLVKKQAERKRSAVADLITFQVSVDPPEARPGEVVKLTFKGTLKEGYHTYPFTKRTAKQETPGYLTSVLKYEDTPGLQPLWKSLTETKTKFVREGEDIYLEHDKTFILTQDILIMPEATPDSIKLPIKIELQVCKGTCLHGFINLEAKIKVAQGEPVPFSAELKQRLKNNHPQPPTVVEPGGGDLVVTPGVQAPASAGLIAFILSGIFWGAVSLITPCVFPMIPITVSFFLKQSEKEHHRPITMALVYCTTIIVVLTIAAVALLSFFRGLSTSPLMNFVIGGLFVFFALSLFGMYEIELPSGLARFTSAREGRGGLMGTMFMALTFTIISFACVAPFLGGFGGTAAGSSLSFSHRVFGGLAFAATFASPFFILALFPTLLKKIPKSGSWLNSVKVVMGFLELAAALKFLRAGELVVLSKPAFFTYDFVLGLYIALSLLCGLYLLNVFRLPHDTPVEHLTVPRMLFSFAFLGLAFYLTPALFKFGEKGQSQRPAGVVFAWLDSFLLPDEEESDLPWTGDLKMALAEAKNKGKLVFIDFTGATCTNCKLNEREVFSLPTVKDLLKQYQLVQLYTDKVPDRFYPPLVRAKFGNGTSRQRQDAQKNLQLQREKFNDEQLPLYIILQPLSGGEYQELARYNEGKINNQPAFIEFLSKPLEALNAGKGKATRVGLLWNGKVETANR